MDRFHNHFGPLKICISRDIIWDFHFMVQPREKVQDMIRKDIVLYRGNVKRLN